MTLAPEPSPTKAEWKPRKTTLELMKAALAPRNHNSPVPYGASPLTSLDVRLLRAPVFRIRNCSKWRDEAHPRALQCSIRNMGDGAVRIIGKKWTVRSHQDGTQVIEGDELFGSRPLLCQGQIFAFNGLQMLRLPARIQLTLLVRDEGGMLYHTDPVSLTW
ncbi:MAG: hypothetical protein ACLSUW_00425 [Akkermansia sp.]